MPCDVTNERSSSALSGKSAVMDGASFLLWMCFERMNLQRGHISSRVQQWRRSAEVVLEVRTEEDGHLR
jgi:hypothetical protein